MVLLHGPIRPQSSRPLSFSVLSAFSSSIRNLAVAVLPSSRRHQGSLPVVVLRVDLGAVLVQVSDELRVAFMAAFIIAVSPFLFFAFVSAPSSGTWTSWSGCPLPP